MRVIRAESYATVPWKNDLGTTREILCHPQGAPGTGDFLYRLSIAEVTQSCDFSAFPGYDRTIMLLDGGGFVLRFADGRTHDLTRTHTPYPFDGAAPVACTVAEGPSQDLNLMVRRGAVAATCSVLEIVGRMTLPPVPGAIRLIVALTEGMTVQSGGQTIELGRWDTVCIDAAAQPGDAVCKAAGSASFFLAAVRLRGSES